MPINAVPILDSATTFDPAEDFDVFLKRVPARWAVYLMADEAGRPIQLLCVKNLRASLKRRLDINGATTTHEIVPLEAGDAVVVTAAVGVPAPSRRIDYRGFVRRISWTRVDSAFEADWIYFEAARHAFPQTYTAMVGFRPAWFVHVHPDANFPRYIKTRDLAIGTGELLGPVEDKHATARLIELIEDGFDLCRYYPILAQAPRAKACAYKEMGKCPAPCDGSISMPQYRRMIGNSVAAVIEPAAFVAEHTARMQQAARELRFEIAGKIKQLMDEFKQLGVGPFRHVRRLRDFRFVSLQRGPRQGDAKIFLVTPGHINCVACLSDVPDRSADLLGALHQAAVVPAAPLDDVAAEHVGIVANHLFSPKSSAAAFLPLALLDDRTLLKAYRDVLKQKPSDEAIDEEGVMKELQAV